MAGHSGYKRENTLVKAASRERQRLPKDREKRVQLVTRLVTHASPCSQALYKESLGTLSPSSKRKLNFIQSAASSLQSGKLGRSKTAQTVRHATLLSMREGMVKGTVRQIRHSYGVGYKSWKKLKSATSLVELQRRKTRKDAIQSPLKAAVKGFYARADISKPLPTSKGTKRTRDGQIISRSVLEKSINDAYDQFKQENGRAVISRSAFAKLRPRHVLPSTSSHRRDCLCEKCENFNLKLEACRVTAAKSGITLVLGNKHQVTDSCLCLREADGYNKRKCLMQECRDCGVKNLQEKLNPISDQPGPFRVKVWEYVKDTVTNKPKMTRVEKQLSGKDLVDGLVDDYVGKKKGKVNKNLNFAKHLFDASWQAKQYSSVSAKPPPGTVVLCQDYAENFACRYQNEVQGAYFNIPAVTLHGTVANYICQEEDCELVVEHSLLAISSDRKHDASGVAHYTNLAMGVLQDREQHFEKVIIFSDGAPGQYKNKNCLTDMSFGECDWGVKCAERHFFGTRHGKGPCDREFGTVKRSLRLLVAGGHDLTCGEDVYRVAVANLTRSGRVHFKRNFFWVGHNDIPRDRERLKDLNTLEDTKLQHSFRMVCGLTIQYRERSCFCSKCQEGDKCQYFSLTTEWRQWTFRGYGPPMLPQIEQVSSYIFF